MNWFIKLFSKKKTTPEIVHEEMPKYTAIQLHRIALAEKIVGCLEKCPDEYTAIVMDGGGKMHMTDFVRHKNGSNDIAAYCHSIAQPPNCIVLKDTSLRLKAAVNKIIERDSKIFLDGFDCSCKKKEE